MPATDPMPVPPTPTVDDLIVRAAVSDVLQRYVRGIDRFDLAAVRTCFHPDAYDDHNTYRGSASGFVDWLEPRLGRHAATCHFLSEPVVRRTADDVAQSDCVAVVHQVSPANDDGRRTVVVEGLRYLDRFERRDGGWRIAHRKVAVDWRYVLPVDSEGGPPFPEGFLVGRRDRTDPSYEDVGPAPSVPSRAAGPG